MIGQSRNAVRNGDRVSSTQQGGYCINLEAGIKCPEPPTHRFLVLRSLYSQLLRFRPLVLASQALFQTRYSGQVNKSQQRQLQEQNAQYSKILPITPTPPVHLRGRSNSNQRRSNPRARRSALGRSDERPYSNTTTTHHHLHIRPRPNPEALVPTSRCIERSRSHRLPFKSKQHRPRPRQNPRSRHHSPNHHRACCKHHRAQTLRSVPA
ncbi:hypothetical protein BDR22DRAFT_904674 [Usnea florida]